MEKTTMKEGTITHLEAESELLDEILEYLENELK